MKRIIAFFAAVLVFAMLTVAVSADTFDGTKVRSNTADPNLFFHDGKYYMTQTGTSRIAVFETEHVDELGTLTLSSNIEYTSYYNGTVYDPTVIELFGSGATVNGTWSPELHYFSEEEFPGQSGWYMFLGLRKNTGDSSMVRMVVLKSTTDSPKGPYGHPTAGTLNCSQPVLDADGNVWDEWACGQTTLTIPEGEYKGTYAMWVAEEGRGQSGEAGEFYQKIMIAKMKSPWQFDGEPGIVATPTQSWEYAGASSTHPRVVEGATPVYGKNGEIFITYSGSGYWSDYGLGQLTWNGGDPLKTSSWVKLSVANGNPIFSAVEAENLRGAGHASFLTDTDGNGFICYHAYAYEDGKKASSRDAYIEPYYIDYTRWNGVSYGVITIGLNGDGVPADTASTVTFATDGEYLTAPDVYSLGRTFAITLNMSEVGAEGFIIYKSEDGKVFDYLATTVGSTYVDEDVTKGETYYYRVYAYREEEISPASEIKAGSAGTVSPKTLSATANGGVVTVSVYADDNYDSVCLYRSEDGTSYGTYIQEIENVSYGETVEFTDIVTESGTYYYMATGVNDGYEYFPVTTVSVDVVMTEAPVISRFGYNCELVKIVIEEGDIAYDSYNVYRSEYGSDFSLIASGTDTVYYDEDVSLGGVYYYMVSGVVNGAESLLSESMTAKIQHIGMSGDALEPTCTEDGYTAYTYCVQCAEVLSGKEVVLATGHVDTESVTVDATCTENGSVTVTCKCGEVVSTEVLESTGHSHEITEEEIPATTTSVGKTAVYTCTACGDSYGGEEIPMLDSTDEFTVAGDANRDGTVDMLDVIRTLKIFVGESVDANLLNADVNENGEIDIEDILAILKMLLD